MVGMEEAIDQPLACASNPRMMLWGTGLDAQVGRDRGCFLIRLEGRCTGSSGRRIAVLGCCFGNSSIAGV